MYKHSFYESPVVDVQKVVKELGESGKRVSVLWQEKDALTFIARGREYRSEFHINPSDEIQYVIKGEMNLHIRTPEGEEKIVVIPEGGLNFIPGGMPHSPRFPPDSYIIVSERQRHPGEEDRFQWYCSNCDKLLHEETFVVADYTGDPVSQAYANFFNSQENRTCKSCGHVTPAPETF